MFHQQGSFRRMSTENFSLHWHLQVTFPACSSSVRGTGGNVRQLQMHALQNREPDAVDGSGGPDAKGRRGLLPHVDHHARQQRDVEGAQQAAHGARALWLTALVVGRQHGGRKRDFVDIGVVAFVSGNYLYSIRLQMNIHKRK